MAVTFEPEPLLVPAKQKRKGKKKSDDEIAFNQALGTRLREERVRRDKSQKEVAAELRIGESQYLRYELGEAAFPPYLLVTLAGLCNKSLHWLITGHDE